MGYINWMSGFILLIGYLGTDAFTSNWQGALYTEYKMSSIQMMAGVNLFSCLLTSVSLLKRGVFNFVRCKDYPGIQFVKRLSNITNSTIQKAEVQSV